MLRFASQKASQEHPEQFTLWVMSALVLKQVMRSGLSLAPGVIISKAQLFHLKVVRLHFHLEGCCEDKGR